MSRAGGSDYAFVESDVNLCMAKMVEAYERITKRTIQPGSPDRLFLAWIADVLCQICAQINYAGSQNIPSRAEGDDLDSLGELFYDSNRPEAKAASCTMKFTISAAQNAAVLIPAGTRTTTIDGAITFKTDTDVYVPIGGTTATASATCTTVGAAGNGYVAGQLSVLVDVFGYYQSCANTNQTDGGADEATDDEYYELMRASSDAYSDAGAQGGYIYFTKSVSTEIADVKAIRPSEAIKKTLTVYDGHAFLGGDGLQKDTLKVFSHGATTQASVTRDYTVDYISGLLTLSIVSTGSLSSAQLIDVEIDNIMAGHVRIYVLMNDGTIASSTMKALVLAKCSDKEVRPLTDNVSVEDPITVPYNIECTYYIPRGSTQSSTEIQASVSKAVEAYKAWQCAKLGRSINPSKLVSRLMATGIKRVDLTSPAYRALGDGSDHHAPELAVIGSTTVTNGGYEDE
ncbi:MAG: baseplate J/gp47 family protein [Clostridia bacterium]